MQVANQKLSADAQEASRAEYQKLLTEFRIDSEQSIETIQAAIMTKIENRKQKFLSKIAAITEKLQVMHRWVNKRITSVEEKVSSLEKIDGTKVINLKKSVDRKLVIMEEKINNQCELLQKVLAR